jgi:hypothetical protein
MFLFSAKNSAGDFCCTSAGASFRFGAMAAARAPRGAEQR